MMGLARQGNPSRSRGTSKPKFQRSCPRNPHPASLSMHIACQISAKDNVFGVLLVPGLQRSPTGRTIRMQHLQRRKRVTQHIITRQERRKLRKGIIARIPAMAILWTRWRGPVRMRTTVTWTAVSMWVRSRIPGRRSSADPPGPRHAPRRLHPSALPVPLRGIPERERITPGRIPAGV